MSQKRSYVRRHLICLLEKLEFGIMPIDHKLSHGTIWSENYANSFCLVIITSVDEIKQRTQGPNESMGIYVATMVNMFNRLVCPVSDPLKLKILQKNISPFYQSQLGLVKIQSIQQLVELGRQLEERKEAIENFAPPPRSKKLLEPDLAYIYSTSSTASSSHEVDVAEISCWNCKGIGHRAAECRAPKSKYCFKCGQANYTVRTCPKCSRDSGNLQRRH